MTKCAYGLGEGKKKRESIKRNFLKALDLQDTFMNVYASV